MASYFPAISRFGLCAVAGQKLDPEMSSDLSLIGPEPDQRASPLGSPGIDVADLNHGETERETTMEVRCGKCQGIVSRLSVVALGKFFHPECFACRLCGRNLANQSYTAWESQPICESCFRKLPQRFQRVINGFAQEFKRQREGG
jgi:hypothetical protein